jgi:hypothetical protein
MIIVAGEERLPGSGQAFLSSFWTIEEDPGYEVLREIHETMGFTDPNKKDITTLKDNLFRSAKETTCPANDDIYLVAGVRMLGIRPARRVNFDAETSMREQLGKALTVGPRQAIQSIVNS